MVKKSLAWLLTLAMLLSTVSGLALFTVSADDAATELAAMLENLPVYTNSKPFLDATLVSNYENAVETAKTANSTGTGVEEALAGLQATTAALFGSTLGYVDFKSGEAVSDASGYVTLENMHHAQYGTAPDGTKAIQGLDEPADQFQLNISGMKAVSDDFSLYIRYYWNCDGVYSSNWIYCSIMAAPGTGCGYTAPPTVQFIRYGGAPTIDGIVRDKGYLGKVVPKQWTWVKFSYKDVAEDTIAFAGGSWGAMSISEILICPESQTEAMDMKTGMDALIAKAANYEATDDLTAALAAANEMKECAYVGGATVAVYNHLKEVIHKFTELDALSELGALLDDLPSYEKISSLLDGDKITAFDSAVSTARTAFETKVDVEIALAGLKAAIKNLFGANYGVLDFTSGEPVGDVYNYIQVDSANFAEMGSIGGKQALKLLDQDKTYCVLDVSNFTNTVSGKVALYVYYYANISAIYGPNQAHCSLEIAPGPGVGYWSAGCQYMRYGGRTKGPDGNWVPSTFLASQKDCEWAWQKYTFNDASIGTLALGGCAWGQMGIAKVIICSLDDADYIDAKLGLMELQEKAQTAYKYDALTAALKTADALLDGANVNYAGAADAATYAVLKQAVLKAPLKEAIDMVDDLSIYTKTSADLYQIALDSAINVMNNANALENDVTLALSNLNRTRAALVMRVDKETLQMLVNAALTDLSPYTKESADVYTNALNTAKEILLKDPATDAEIAAAQNGLIDAKKALELKPDYTALDAIIAEAEGLDLSGVDAALVDALNSAINAGKEAKTNGAKQAGVDAAALAVRKAITRITCAGMYAYLDISGFDADCQSLTCEPEVIQGEKSAARAGGLSGMKLAKGTTVNLPMTLDEQFLKDTAGKDMSVLVYYYKDNGDSLDNNWEYIYCGGGKDGKESVGYYSRMGTPGGEKLGELTVCSWDFARFDISADTFATFGGIVNIKALANVGFLYLNRVVVVPTDLLDDPVKPLSEKYAYANFDVTNTYTEFFPRAFANEWDCAYITPQVNGGEALNYTPNVTANGHGVMTNTIYSYLQLNTAFLKAGTETWNKVRITITYLDVGAGSMMIKWADKTSNEIVLATFPDSEIKGTGAVRTSSLIASNFAITSDKMNLQAAFAIFDEKYTTDFQLLSVVIEPAGMGDKTALTEKIAEAKAIDVGKLSGSTYDTALRDAINAAQELLDTSGTFLDEDKANEAIKAIDDAVAAINEQLEYLAKHAFKDYENNLTNLLKEVLVFPVEAEGFTYYDYDADNDFVLDSKGNKYPYLTFTVKYLDKGEGDIKLWYQTSDPVSQDWAEAYGECLTEVTVATLTNSGETKTAIVKVLDAAFNDTWVLGGDIEIGIPYGTECKLLYVGVDKTEPDLETLKALADRVMDLSNASEDQKNAYNNAKNVADPLLVAETVTVPEVDAAIKALKDAIDAIDAVNLAAAKDALQKAVDKAISEDDLSKYTYDTATEYWTALQTAKEILEKDGATEDELKSAKADLDKAESALELDAILGDVDGDNTITSTDARLVLQLYAKKISASQLNTGVADVDGDGEITSTDARLILQRYAKKIDHFPVEE